MDSLTESEVAGAEKLTTQLIENAEAVLASSDVILIYAAGGGRRLLEALVSFTRWSLIFVRHRSGPLYLWYEIVHPRFLRKRSDEFRQPGMGVDDVIVDDYGKIASKLRALYGLKNTLGSRFSSTTRLIPTMAS